MATVVAAAVVVVVMAAVVIVLATVMVIVEDRELLTCACPVVSSGSENTTRFSGGGGGEQGWSCAGGEVQNSWPSGNERSSSLTSFILVVFLYHLVRVVSLMGNNAKLVPSIRAALFERRALMQLYSSRISFHLDVYRGLCPLCRSLRGWVIESHNLTHRASTTRLFEGEQAGKLVGKKHLRKRENNRAILLRFSYSTS